MIVLKNEHLKVEIAELGAEMKSVCCNGVDYLWRGDEKWWNGSAPVLFPICSSLKNNQYTFDGKTYEMKIHGFAKKSVFKLEQKTDTSATFLLSSSFCKPDSYPFDYELRITYTLCGKKIDVKYVVFNPSDSEMYFSIGAHEGYFCDGGLSNYEVIFDKEESLDACQLEGPILSGKTVNIAKNCKVLPIKDEYFKVDALIFKNLNSRGLYLRNVSTDQKIRVDFEGFDYLLLWSKPGAPYLCIEPWCGITDSVTSSGNIREKEGIIRLDGGCTCVREHSLEIM